MNRRHAAVALLLGAASPAFAQNDGLQLATSVAERPSGRDFTAHVRMELGQVARDIRMRTLVSYRLEGGGTSVDLMRFLSPRDVAGTGLLSVNRADGSSEQALYLPALDRTRRIASDRKGGRFVGSDIYYEDLQERRPELDRHRLLGQEALGSIRCEVLESVPLDPGSSVYSKRVSWIDTRTLLPHRVDYFERDADAPSKRWELLAHEKVQGYWTVMDSRVTDLKTGHSTRLTVEKPLYDRGLPARLFTPQALADEAIEAEFRP